MKKQIIGKVVLGIVILVAIVGAFKLMAWDESRKSVETETETETK